ncbi:hypothetical protein [Promicromonospora sp. NPDC050880]|uniref:hypothetical protein n=1 Tax=Promicromonospora sp. NPDC050880 TaxID=3364406 RepID=UPI0037AA0478
MSDEQQTSSATHDIPTLSLDFERVFSANQYAGEGSSWPSSVADHVAEPTPGLFEIIGSTRPRVVVTAPHATNHERAGSTKVADRGTGGLAVLLAHLTGCTALVALGAPGDANFDGEHPLKDRLAELRPTIVIDLHGMRTRVESDVDLGTGAGLVPSAVSTLAEDSDLRVTVNQVFDAMRPTTVTAFAQELGIPAVQVEIGAHLRPPLGTPKAVTRLVALLTHLVEAPVVPPTTDLVTIPVRIASGLPTAVVHPDLLSGIDGPVPITVLTDVRQTIAWAWSATADGVPESAEALSPGRIGVSRRLRSELGDARSVAVRVPPLMKLRTVAALVDDMPGVDEVHVNPADVRPGTYLLMQRGVTAWVRAVGRDHVLSGTVRLAYQLRLLTASDGDGPDPGVLLVAAAPQVIARSSAIGRFRRVRNSVDNALEHLWRALFRAPEFSARVVQAHAGDDGSAVVTLHPAVFDRLGIVSGQQVLVRWGGREVVALAVADHDPPVAAAQSASMRRVQRVNRLWPDLPDGMSPHVTVRVSTRLREELRAPVATVVTMRRRLRPVLVQNLNALVVPLASLVLAGAALPDPHWPTLGLGTALMSLFAMARLRIPQPRSGARVDREWVEHMAGPDRMNEPEALQTGERLGR